MRAAEWGGNCANSNLHQDESQATQLIGNGKLIESMQGESPEKTQKRKSDKLNVSSGIAKWIVKNLLDLNRDVKPTGTKGKRH